MNYQKSQKNTNQKSSLQEQAHIPVNLISKDSGKLLMRQERCCLLIAHIAGLVVAGEHCDPVPYSDFVTTTTHKTLRGPRGGMIMCREDMQKISIRRFSPESKEALLCML